MYAPLGGLVAKTLAEMVHDKLDAGTLPREDVVKLWAGMGSGKACTACEQPILSEQPEYEIEFDDGRVVIRLHAECHTVWEAECKPAMKSATASLADVSNTTTSDSSHRVRGHEKRSAGLRGRPK
jgi:hypothetical protein